MMTSRGEGELKDSILGYVQVEWNMSHTMVTEQFDLTRW